MTNIKHIGQLVSTGRRIVVVFREVPEETGNCLVVDTEAMPDWMHDDIIRAVESPAGQATKDFYEYAQRTMFTDGTNMLQGLHSRGILMKQPTSNVLMTPNTGTTIKLDELNTMIGEQTGSTVVTDSRSTPTQLGMAGADTTLDDSTIAANMLQQATGFEAEAKSLREQAYDLDASLKPKRGRPAKAKAKVVTAETEVSTETVEVTE
jgi:hypothetical protein